MGEKDKAEVIELTKEYKEYSAMDDMAELERRERILQMQNSGIAISAVSMIAGVVVTLTLVWFFKGL